jgi:hypothetical protein
MNDDEFPEEQVVTRRRRKAVWLGALLVAVCPAVAIPVLAARAVQRQNREKITSDEVVSRRRGGRVRGGRARGSKVARAGRVRRGGGERVQRDEEEQVQEREQAHRKLHTTRFPTPCRSGGCGSLPLSFYQSGVDGAMDALDGQPQFIRVGKYRERGW